MSITYFYKKIINVNQHTFWVKVQTKVAVILTLTVSRLHRRPLRCQLIVTTIFRNTYIFDALTEPRQIGLYICNYSRMQQKRQVSKANVVT